MNHAAFFEAAGELSNWVAHLRVLGTLPCARLRIIYAANKHCDRTSCPLSAGISP
jgi:hypothetical protein